MKKFITILLLLITVLLFSCNNAFHDSFARDRTARSGEYGLNKRTAGRLNTGRGFGYGNDGPKRNSSESSRGRHSGTRSGGGRSKDRYEKAYGTHKPNSGIYGGGDVYGGSRRSKGYSRNGAKRDNWGRGNKKDRYENAGGTHK
ncbi:MAG: hypothetical protein WCM76_10355, partial [Bacteroidota bacterium]